MDREVLDRWCERGILGLTLGILVSMPLAFGGQPQPVTRSGSILDFWLLDPFLLAEWLTVGILALWLVRVWVSPKPRFLWPPIVWAVIGFTLYAIARYDTADIEYVARQELLRILVYAFVFLAVLNHLHRKETTQIVVLSLIFVAMAISFYAIYQFLAGSDRVWYVHSKEYLHRGMGSYICPNHLAGFLEMLLPLGLAYTLMGRVKSLLKVFVGYASLIILAGIGVTVSRGGWVSTAAVLLLFFGALLAHRSFRLPAVVVLVLLLGIGLYVIPRTEIFQARARQIFAHGQLDDDARFALWRPAIQVWRENFWWGAGPDHYDYRFRQHRPEDIQLQADHAHNDYLNLLADWGLAGLVLVVSAWGLLALGAWKTWRHVRKSSADLGAKLSNTKFAFVLGASLGLTAILVHSVVDFNMHIPANALVAVTLMALLSGYLRFASERYWFTLAPWTKVLTTLILGAGAAYLTAQAWRHSVESIWLARAAHAEKFSPAQVDLLKRAFAVEPRNAKTANAVGEALRLQSLEGGRDYRQLAAQAMEWYDRGRKLNPWDSAGELGYGWCLDWLGRVKEADPIFDRAEQLDPNGYYTVANIGLHYFQSGDYAAARPWFERSLHLKDRGNPVATAYLALINQQLLTEATNELRASLDAAIPAAK